MQTYSKSVVALSACLISIAGSAASQDSCGSILSGIYDHRVSVSDRTRVTSFTNWMCASEGIDTSGKVAAPIQNVPTELSGELSWAKEQCGLTAQNTFNRDRMIEIVRKLNPQVVEAWDRCMAYRGLKAGIIYSDDPKRFNIEINYVPVSDGQPTAKLLDGPAGFHVSGGVTCTVPWPNEVNRVISMDLSLPCKRSDPKVSVRVTLNANPSPLAGSRTIDLPAHRVCKKSSIAYSARQLGLPVGQSLDVNCGFGSKFTCRHQNGSVEIIDWEGQGWTQADRITFAFRANVPPDHYLGLSVNGTKFGRNGVEVGCRYNSLALSCVKTVCN